MKYKIIILVIFILILICGIAVFIRTKDINEKDKIKEYVNKQMELDMNFYVESADGVVVRKINQADFMYVRFKLDEKKLNEFINVLDNKFKLLEKNNNSLFYSPDNIKKSKYENILNTKISFEEVEVEIEKSYNIFLTQTVNSITRTRTSRDIKISLCQGIDKNYYLYIIG